MALTTPSLARIDSRLRLLRAALSAAESKASDLARRYSALPLSASEARRKYASNRWAVAVEHRDNLRRLLKESKAELEQARRAA